MDNERVERMRSRLTKYGKGILSKETIERMCSGQTAEPKTVEEKYTSMYIYPSKPRQTDKDGIRMSKREVKRALHQVREDLGLPDFRHKMWKGVKI